MPAKGFTCITIRRETYEKWKEYMTDLGLSKMTTLLELAVKEYIEEHLRFRTLGSPKVRLPRKLVPDVVKMKDLRIERVGVPKR